MAKRLEHTAAAKNKKMTFGELVGFVADARANGAADTDLVEADATFSGHLRELALTIAKPLQQDAPHPPEVDTPRASGVPTDS